VFKGKVLFIGNEEKIVTIDTDGFYTIKRKRLKKELSSQEEINKFLNYYYYILNILFSPG
jgi:hypothetical protein